MVSGKMIKGKAKENISFSMAIATKVYLRGIYFKGKENIHLNKGRKSKVCGNKDN